MTLLVFAAPVAAEEVTAFAAASLTDALKDVAQGFEAKTGHKVVFNLGASNDLARQIRAGALADVFFSADKAQMDGLEAAGLVRAANRVACCPTSSWSSYRCPQVRGSASRQTCLLSSTLPWLTRRRFGHAVIVRPRRGRRSAPVLTSSWWTSTTRPSRSLAGANSNV
jgi:hypothetical protein